MGGKSIRIFLADGNPDGLRKAEIVNWTGKVSVVSRSQLAELFRSERQEEYNRTGIYILVGENPEDPFQQMVYIGESDNVLNRLKNHSSDEKKDFWIHTIIITSKDENLTKAHVRYLESRLIGLTAEANRARLSNDTQPEPVSLPESDKSDMEYFLDQTQQLLSVLSFSFAKPIPTPPAPPKQILSTNLVQPIPPIFHIDFAQVDANAQEIDGEFVVLKDSTIRKSDTPTIGEHFKRLREQLLADGKLIDSTQSNYWLLSQDIPFSSPSTAASVVTGTQLNGRKYWKLKGTNTTYGEWQEQQIEQADTNNEQE